jgi:hypothetical protein
MREGRKQTLPELEALQGFDPELRVVVASPNSGFRDVTTLAKLGLIIAPDEASDHELADDEAVGARPLWRPSALAFAMPSR